MPPGSSPTAPGLLVDRWTTVDGRPAYYRASTMTGPTTSGPALPVVMVHGLGVSGRYMVPTAERLARTCRVFVPDMPGFGRTPGPPEALDVPALAAFIDAWMDAVGLERAAWVGNSFGGQVIAELALRRPGRVAAAVLQGLTPDPAHPSRWWHTARAAVDALREPLPLLLIATRDYLIAGPRRFVRTYRYVVEDPIEAKLARLRVPVLVVRGARDAIVGQAWAERAAALVPGGRLAVVPGAAHGLNYSHPAALAGLARAFFDEVLEGAAAGAGAGG